VAVLELGRLRGVVSRGAQLLRLRVNDGSEEKSYTFKLQRFELSDKERNLTPMARWIITEIAEGEA
jgi:hypothetical protein